LTFRADQQNAVETANSTERRHSLSTEGREKLKAYLLSDSYAFAEVICGHQDLIPEFHAPISYAFCHLTDKFIHTLDDPFYESFVTRYIRAELESRKIKWNTRAGRDLVDALLDILNVRTYRGSFKSSVGTHAGGTFIGTTDPNRTMWLVSNSDPNAWAFCKQIGDTIQSGVYQDWFPERAPQGNANELITNKHVTLGGRTISHPQTNIEADGYLTKRISAHFDTFIVDDIVVRENSTPAELPYVHRWIAGMPGYEMATRRVWQRFEGTRWADNDDHRAVAREELRDTCLSIVVPIEVYESGHVENILERGTPTNPKLHPREKIAKLQAKYLADEKEGPISWRCNALLDPSATSGRIFADHVIDDPFRRYATAPLPNDPKLDFRRKKGEYLVKRYVRDAKAKIVEKDGVPQWKTFDPWRQLDRVMTIDPAWEDGGDNWAVTCEGWDFEGYRFQLETQSGTDGQEGWIDAAAEIDAFWRPRKIGFDGAAMQNKNMQNLMRYDPRLRRLRSRMEKVPHNNVSKRYRIKQFVAEPLNMYMLLLDPRTDPAGPNGIETREEMHNYRGGDSKDGILDTLAMCPALALRRRSPDDLAKLKSRALIRSAPDAVTGTAHAA